LRSGPTQLLIIGDAGFELCQECVEELKTAIAAPQAAVPNVHSG
jgi:hypothetical protein